MSFVILSGPTPWSTEIEPKTKSGAPKIARNRSEAIGRHPVIHPIFQTFSDMSDDPYWKELFLNVAKGSLPRCFIFYDSTLSHRLRTKVSDCYVDKSNPVAAYPIVKKFFIDKGRSLGSQIDNENKIPDKIEVPVIDSWTKLRGTKSKQIAVAQFVSNISRIMKLNDIQKANLAEMVWIGILANYFNNSTIKVVDGAINSIDGLKESSSGDFYIDIEVDHGSLRKSKRGEEDLQSLLSTIDEVENNEDIHRPTIHTQWTNFLKNWNKRLQGK